jgi:Helix-turn-helix.
MNIQLDSMSSEQLKKFGRQVRELRLSRAMTQEGLAERSGLHPTYIGGIERGERNIGLLNLLRLAKSLSVPPSHLISSFDAEVTDDDEEN